MAQLKWHTYAGGTSAAEGKKGYSTGRTEYGHYDITPLASRYGMHMGYRLYFVNDKGRLGGGLWQQIGSLYRSPNEAKVSANSHFAKHFAKRNRRR